MCAWNSYDWCWQYFTIETENVHLLYLYIVRLLPTINSSQHATLIPSNHKQEMLSHLFPDPTCHIFRTVILFCEISSCFEKYCRVLNLKATIEYRQSTETVHTLNIIQLFAVLECKPYGSSVGDTNQNPRIADQGIFTPTGEHNRQTLFMLWEKNLASRGNPRRPCKLDTGQ